MTADDLRARLHEILWRRGIDQTGGTINDILAALAGDPGDLPARMAEAIRSHDIDEARKDWWDEIDPYCVCGEQVKDWDEHAAKAAMSVRWEHAASQAAEVERLRAELAEAKARVHQLEAWGDEKHTKRLIEIDQLKDRLYRRSVELERTAAERDALRAAIDTARTRVRLHLSEVEGQERVRKVVGQMDAEDLRKILADLDVPETPGDANANE